MPKKIIPKGYGEHFDWDRAPTFNKVLPEIGKMRKFSVNFLLNEEPSMNLIDATKWTRMQRASNAVSSITKMVVDAVRLAPAVTRDFVTRTKPEIPSLSKKK